MKYSLEESEFIFISKEKDMIINYNLYAELKDNYKPMLEDIISETTN